MTKLTSEEKWISEILSVFPVAGIGDYDKAILTGIIKEIQNETLEMELQRKIDLATEKAINETRQTIYNNMMVGIKWDNK